MSKLWLTSQNSAIALIDYQPAMYQGVQSHDRLVVINDIQVLAKAATLFKIPGTPWWLRAVPASPSARNSPRLAFASARLIGEATKISSSSRARGV